MTEEYTDQRQEEQAPIEERGASASPSPDPDDLLAGDRSAHEALNRPYPHPDYQYPYGGNGIDRPPTWRQE